MDRRTFFGVMAAPIVAKALPLPEPKPLNVENIKAAMGVLQFHADNGEWIPLGDIESLNRFAPPSDEERAEWWRNKTSTLLDSGTISFDLTFAPNKP